MTTTHDVLSPHDVLTLADAIRLINDGAAIRWTPGDGVIRKGTLRHLAPADGDANHARWGTDVRDMWVRITMVSGTDTWVRLTDLARWLASGCAAVAR